MIGGRMHDWTLKKIEFDWRSACVTLELEDSAFVARTLTAEGVRELQIPHANEWGPSASVNEISAIEPLLAPLQQLKIEMQSGDVIRIVAERFTLPE